MAFRGAGVRRVAGHLHRDASCESVPEQPNKTDRIDARGIAQMMRVNLYRPVHVSRSQARSGGHS